MDRGLVCGVKVILPELIIGSLRLRSCCFVLNSGSLILRRGFGGRRCWGRRRDE